MSIEVQRRRGTTAQHSTFTGAAGEITVDTDKNTAVVHDGSTAGGYPLAKASDLVDLSLVAEYEVSGGAVTDIDFTGLDINSDVAYRIEFEFINALGSATSINMYVDNGGTLDTTDTNYYRQTVFASGTTITAGRGNLPTVIAMDASDRTTGSGLLHKTGALTGNGRPMAEFNMTRASGSLVQFQSYNWSKTADVDNITKIRFSSATAGAIANGSRVRIFIQ